MTKQSKATEFFEKGLKFFPKNIQLLIEFANHLDTFNVEYSSKIYKKIFPLVKQNGSLQLFNNMIVSLIKTNDLDLAEEILAVALESIPSNKSELQKAVLLSLKFNETILLEKRGRFRESLAKLTNIVQNNNFMIEAKLKCIKMYFQFGNEDQAHLLIQQSLKTLVNRDFLKLILSVYFYELLRKRDYSTAIEYLEKLKLDEDSDLYLYTLYSIFLFKIIPFHRDNLKQAKFLIKKVAEIANTVLSKKDEKNIITANLMGSLLIERGKLRDSLKIMSELRDNSNIATFNTAFIEFLFKNYSKAKTILENPSLPNSYRKKTFYILLLMLTEQYEETEKALKYKFLLNPTCKNKFNLVSFLNEITHKQLKDKNKMKIEKLLEKLELIKKMFKSILKRIGEKDLTILEQDYNSDSLKKTRLKKIKKKINEKLFFIQENSSKYEEVLKEQKVKQEKLQKNLSIRQNLLLKEKENQMLQEKMELAKIEEEKRLREEKAKFLNSDFDQSENMFSNIFTDLNKKSKGKSTKKEKESFEVNSKIKLANNDDNDNEDGDKSYIPKPVELKMEKKSKPRRLRKVKKEIHEDDDEKLILSESSSVSESEEIKSLDDYPIIQKRKYSEFNKNKDISPTPKIEDNNEAMKIKEEAKDYQRDGRKKQKLISDSESD